MKKENIDLNMYEQVDKSFSMGNANIWGTMIMIPMALILFGIQVSINENRGQVEPKFILMLVIVIVGIVIHELVHGVTWSLFCREKLKSIKFGFDKKTFTPYAHCKELLNVNEYRIGTILPTILTGIIPYIIGIAINNYTLTMAGVLLTCSGGGDLMVLYSIIKEKSTSLVIDHPSACGCMVYRKK